VSPVSAAPGTSIVISGNVPATGAASCPSSASAQLTSTAGLFPPDGFGPQAARGPNGDFNASYTIPASAPAGSYDIGIRCAGGNVGVSAALQVIRPVATTSPPPTTTSLRPTTTVAVTTTTVVPSTLLAPATTTPSSGAGGGGSVLPWVALGVVVGVLLAGVGMLAVNRRRIPARP
jgi:hypothetical protein